MGDQSMSASAARCYHDEGTYALSVWSVPGLTPEQIAQHAREVEEDALPQSVIRVSTVDRLAEAGYHLFQTGSVGHYSLALPEPPTTTDWHNLREPFDDERPNPVAR